jgi:hypothetical protein
MEKSGNILWGYGGIKYLDWGYNGIHSTCCFWECGYSTFGENDGYIISDTMDVSESAVYPIWRRVKSHDIPWCSPQNSC